MSLQYCPFCGGYQTVKIRQTNETGDVYTWAATPAEVMEARTEEHRDRPGTFWCPRHEMEGYCPYHEMPRRRECFWCGFRSGAEEYDYSHGGEPSNV